MPSIELTESQVEEMKSFYIKEYSRLMNELNHVQGMLGSLGIDSPNQLPTELLEESPKTEKSKKKTTPTRKRRKKRGRKATWASFITRRLRQVNRPLTYSQLIQDAILEFDVAKKDEDKARQAIMNSAFRLRKVNHKIDTVGKQGKKEKWVVLTAWMDENGTLTEEYAKKIA